MATLAYTLETLLTPNPDFPSGYAYQNAFGAQSFDFTRNWYYVPIYGSPNGGIEVTDLTTMQVIKTPTMAQMYAGTPYGFTPGSPTTQDVFDCACGSGTDLYILTASNPTYSPAAEFARFTRVNPVTMKVTGEFYISNTFPPPINCVMGGGWCGGRVNTTTSHTIVLYPTNTALNVGPQIFDGTGMAPIGMGPTPTHGNSLSLGFTAGAKRGDGSCDFLMVDGNGPAAAGNIDIWRINVSNTLVITSVKTGTLNVLPVFTPSSSNLWISQAEYDKTHDCLILTVSSSSGVANGTPSWLMSVNYNGTINWSRLQTDIGGSVYNKGQYNLTGTTYASGTSDNLHIYDTATGNTLFIGSILVAGSGAGSFFHVWDASRGAFWTYALSRGFVRVDLVGPLDVHATLTDAELLFEPTASFVDFAVEANRRKFIALGGTPAWMGRDGTLPSGAVPPAYLTTLGPPRDFAQNNGGGGGFAVSGVLFPASGPGCTPYYLTEAAGPAADPQWRLTVSDDGGRTWSTLVKPRSIGALGVYLSRLRWLKMGQSRERMIRLECTDPVRRNIVGIYIDADQGMP